MTGMQTHTTLRWAARILTIPVFLFWGAFFIEHMAWFSNPSNLPPWHVFLMVGCHGLILVGLALSWKWEKIGSIVTIAAATVFFAKVAGPNFILFTMLTSIPSIIFLVLIYLESRGPAVPEGHAA